MNIGLYQSILKSFEGKTTAELRAIVAARDSGEWSEEAVTAAERLLEGRPAESNIDNDSEAHCDIECDVVQGQDPTAAAASEATASPKHVGGVFELSEAQVKGYRLKIRCLGVMYCLFALVLERGAVQRLQSGVTTADGWVRVGAGALMMAIIALTGVGLILLDRRARVPGMIVAVLLLVLFVGLGSENVIGTPLTLFGVVVSFCGMLWLGKRGGVMGR